MMFEQDDSIKGCHRVCHHHMMQKTLFISLLAMHPMVEEEGVKSHATYCVDGPYDQFYHYRVDKTKRQKIERFNKKYALNSVH